MPRLEVLYAVSHGSAAKNIRAMEKSKKRKADSGREIAAYKWECPICNEALDTEGMVPCMIRTCVRTVHMLCLDCANSIKEKACPMCRAAFKKSDLVPLHDLVNPNDAVAQEKLSSVLPKSVPVKGDAVIKKLCKKTANNALLEKWRRLREEAAKDEEKQNNDLREKRLELIVKAVDKLIITAAKNNWKRCIEKVGKPNFETYTLTKQTADMKISLNRIYDSLDKDIAEIFKDSGVSVSLQRHEIKTADYNSHAVPLYMKIMVCVKDE